MPRDTYLLGDRPVGRIGFGCMPLSGAAAFDAGPARDPVTALAWTLAQGPHVLAIPGTGSLAHLEENVAAHDVELTADDLSDLGGPRL